MLDDSVTGGFQAPAIDAAHAFRAAMKVMAQPGTIETINLAQAPAPVSSAAAALLLTLCDAETPVYLAPEYDVAEVRGWIAFHTGAPVVEREKAQFALGRWEEFLPLTTFPLGSPEYPDRSTTLIVECDMLEANGARLSGPGIQTEAFLSLPETDAFAANRAMFPQGLDFFFSCGTRLAALSRTTIVEAG